MSNRLAFESSPYLLQHKDNPVDWYPWGEEALGRARAEDLPILLSVGYSACHWCHVMEHESFSNRETAALMNEYFVNIKVDREERPDVDALYMHAVQRMSGHGGWPMTVFLTPDGAPFYGGTYFPPRPRHGLPSFRQVIESVRAAYRDRRGEVDRSAADIRAALGRDMAMNPGPGNPVDHQLHRARQGITRHFDSVVPGFDGAPRFPQPMLLDFLLRYHERFGDTEGLLMLTAVLRTMANGGIHDQIGGGFHRYSVDAQWLVPHFEKMLYDNALLARVYARASIASGDRSLGQVAESTLDYLLREMRHEAGGFFSSQDADSEGVEGRFYVWDEDEIEDLLDPESAAFAREYYGVTPAGNWEGVNVLHVPRPLDEVAAELRLAPDRAAELLAEVRRTLREARALRQWPGRDEKVLTAWNALALQAFAEAGRILGRPAYIEVAVRNAEFLLESLRPDGALLRSWREGEARIPAFLEDHALLVDALLELYRSTFDLRWVREARAIADAMIDRFWSPGEQLFYDTPASNSDLIVRPRDIHDNATPSGTSAAAQALTRLARITGDPRYDTIADRVVGGMADLASQLPRGFGHLLGAVSARLAPPTEVAIVGDPADPDTRALLDVLDARLLPDTIVALRAPTTPADEAAALIPLLAGREPLGGQPTAFVCRDFACRLPVTTPAELARDLDRLLAFARCKGKLTRRGPRFLLRGPTLSETGRSFRPRVSRFARRSSGSSASRLRRRFAHDAAGVRSEEGWGDIIERFRHTGRR